jgi:chaperone modulatory protein CbpM
MTFVQHDVKFDITQTLSSLSESQFLDPQHQALSFEQMAELSGADAAELQELAEGGALVPLDPAIPLEDALFSPQMLMLVRLALRLRDDFDLGTNALAVILHLLRRIQVLEEELHAH